MAHPSDFWSDERVALLVRYWFQGLSASQVAYRLGSTRNAVLGKLHRLGKAERKAPAPKPGKAAKPAPEQRKAQVIALPNPSEPAPLYPVRNVNSIKPHEVEAIVRLTKRGWSFSAIGREIGRDKKAVARVVRTVLPDYQPHGRPVVRVIPRIVAAPAGDRVVSLLDAGRDQCRWMVNRTHVCGERTDGGSWCPHHRAIVYRRDEQAVFAEAAE